MVSQLKQDITEWRQNHSLEAYSKLYDDLKDYLTDYEDLDDGEDLDSEDWENGETKEEDGAPENVEESDGVKEPDVVEEPDSVEEPVLNSSSVLILEIMSEVLGNNIELSENDDQNKYQLCLDILKNEIFLPSFADPSYNDEVELVIKNLLLLKLSEKELDDEQLESEIYKRVEEFYYNSDNLSATKLYDSFSKRLGIDWVSYYPELLELFLDIAIQEGDDNLGYEIAQIIDDGYHKDDIFYKGIIFQHIGEENWNVLSDSINTLDEFAILISIIEYTPYSYLLFEVFEDIGYSSPYNICDYGCYSAVEWLFEKFKEFKANQDEEKLFTIIDFVLCQIDFDPVKCNLGKEFSFEVLKTVIEMDEPSFLGRLKKTNQEQYVTNDKLYYLKEKIEKGDKRADEVAKILLKKSSYKQFLKTPSAYFLEDTPKMVSTSTPDAAVSNKSEDAKIIESKSSKAKNTSNKTHTTTKAKTKSAKKQYRPNGLKGHFYGLYKFIHGKKK